MAALAPNSSSARSVILRRRSALKDLTHSVLVTSGSVRNPPAFGRSLAVSPHLCLFVVMRERGMGPRGLTHAARIDVATSSAWSVATSHLAGSGDHGLHRVDHPGPTLNIPRRDVSGRAAAVQELASAAAALRARARDPRRSIA